MQGEFVRTKRRLVPVDRRSWLVALAVVALIVAGAGGWVATRSSPSSAATSTTVQATTGTIRQSVRASGTIQPARRADLTFSVAGTVTTVDVSVGDKVKKGARLATVGAADLQVSVDMAQASLDAAEEQLSSQESAGASDVQIASAKAQVAVGESTLQQAKQDRSDATLTAPFAGTVATVSIEAGDSVGSSGTGSSGTGSSGTGSSGTGNAGATSGGATTSSAQIVLISTDVWTVDASLSSADLSSVKKGLQVEITPSGTATKVFGTVSSVGVIASSSGGTATFPVTIAVTGKPAGLYAGGTADVVIIVKQLNDVLTVPTAAIRTVDGKTVVRQVKGGTEVDTPVTVGAVYGPSTQITKGLSAGDSVIVADVRLSGGGGLRSGNTNGGSGGLPGGGQRLPGGGGGGAGGGPAGGGG
jgi:multidrug efflux pump subunit AcrA (membrane-fusion protein)